MLISPSAHFVGRAAVRDNYRRFMTYDAMGNHLGRPLAQAFRTHDGRTVDSTGAFLVGELERLDQKIHEPLASVTYGRDIDMREDVTIADEVSSFTISTYGSAGGLGTGNSIGNGKAWSGKATTQIGGVSVDIAKIPHPLRLWDLEVKYTIPELESAAKMGRPIDQSKISALKLKHQMDIDEQVYIGDTGFGDTGLVNNSLVTNIGNLPNGASPVSPHWAGKQPDEILADINFALNSVWAASGFAVMPERILIPPAQFSQISGKIIAIGGVGGGMSVLKYVLENNLLTTTYGKKLDIQPCKWLIGAGSGGAIGTLGTVDRMVVYTKDLDRVRFPMTLLQKTPIQFIGLYHATTYFCRLGAVEVVYPETIGYFDGL